MAVTFFFTCLAWIFFRAENITEAVSYVGAMFYRITFHPGAVMKWTLSMTMLMVIIMVIIEWINRKKDHGADFVRWPVYIRWPIYYSLILCIVYFGNYQEEISFIYFQF